MNLLENHANLKLIQVQDSEVPHTPPPAPHSVRLHERETAEPMVRENPFHLGLK